MSLEIDGYVQWLLFAKAVLCGACLGVFYDFFRFLRVMKKFGKYSVMVQDIIYWCVSALVVFAFMMIYSCGVVRIYLVAGIFAGEIFYYFSLGRFTFWMFRFIKAMLNTIDKFIKKYILIPIINFIDKCAVSHVKKLFLRLNVCIRKKIKKFSRKSRKTLANSTEFVV